MNLSSHITIFNNLNLFFLNHLNLIFVENYEYNWILNFPIFEHNWNLKNSFFAIINYPKYTWSSASDSKTSTISKDSFKISVQQSQYFWWFTWNSFEWFHFKMVNFSLINCPMCHIFHFHWCLQLPPEILFFLNIFGDFL